MEYKMTRVGTALGVGWFSCIPDKETDMEGALAHIKNQPNDVFMHMVLLDRLRDLNPDELEPMIAKGLDGDPILLALTYEASILNSKFGSLLEHFKGVDVEVLADKTPLMYIEWFLKKNSDESLYWLREFSKNSNLHEPLPAPEESEFPLPFEKSSIDKWLENSGAIEKPLAAVESKKEIIKGRQLREEAGALVKKLEGMGILTGWEARTEATLCPFAVERPWNLEVKVETGRNKWKLTGTLMSYGRGMNIHQARMSCAMEAVERLSAFASIDSALNVTGSKHEYVLKKATWESLKNEGAEVLDPNEMCLEVPYRNQELYWIEGERLYEDGLKKIFIPAQTVLLFSNLDETSLTSGLPSDGLGAGKTMEDAKLHAILEVIERDADKVMPYSMERCFVLDADDSKVRETIEGNLRKGIQIQLLDITSEFGIPCYRAFVQGPGGVLLKGSAAHLDGRAAVVSALTEVPYPYPYWFGSMSAAKKLKTLEYEDLPNLSSGDRTRDLASVESLLLKNGYSPIYLDLTRTDLDIPVVKVLIPGLEMMTVFDRFTPLGLRQFGHYTRLFDG
ncbi:YcaO-like family protein [Thermodesulfobacteriota bacterium]